MQVRSSLPAGPHASGCLAAPPRQGPIGTSAPDNSACSRVSIIGVSLPDPLWQTSQAAAANRPHRQAIPGQRDRGNGQEISRGTPPGSCPTPDTPGPLATSLPRLPWRLFSSAVAPAAGTGRANPIMRSQEPKVREAGFPARRPRGGSALASPASRANPPPVHVLTC